MANMQSPGVQVQVIDESFYLPAAPGTTPMIFIASAQDKLNPSGSVAQGTTAENAGKVWLITSQRDLTDTFGTPIFYTDASGNPQHGGELNEYGLQASYSTLGVSSRCYVVRSDLNTTDLIPSSSEPKGAPVPGTYWLDTDASTFGIKEWNATTQKFTVKTPIVLDDETPADQFDGFNPSDNVGLPGDYAIVVTKDNNNTLYYKASTNIWILVQSFFDSTNKAVVISPHFNYPDFGSNTSTNISGSVWVTTTVPANGANWVIKYYDGDSADWVSVAAPMYDSIPATIYTLDRSGGGKNIPVGTLFIDYDSNTYLPGDAASFKIWRKSQIGNTNIVGATSNTFANSPPNTSTTWSFEIRETLLNSNLWSSTATVTIVSASTTTKLGSLVSSAVASAGLNYIIATWNTSTSKLTMTHKLGGAFELKDGEGGPLNALGYSVYDPVTGNGTANLHPSATNFGFTYVATTFKPLVYEAKSSAPFTDTEDGKLWYNSIVDEVDIMVHDGATWVGYHVVFNLADPNGPIISATKPTEQSDKSPLVTGDIWISTENIDDFAREIYVYDDTLPAGKKWVLQNVTDQSTPEGWLFADARWSTAGESVTKATIIELLNSNYLDPDAPDPALYPKGMRLWNTRRSGFNVKKFIKNYINIEANEGLNLRFNSESMANYFTDRWVSQYPVANDGGPQFGRQAQRAQVVNSLKQLIDSNTAIRDTESLAFNLIAAPGYPEAIQNMIAFNTDRKLTGFVVGDSPFRLQPTATALSEWALNTNGALDNSEVGATSYDEYMAIWYPSGYTNDNTGNRIVVPPSHMMLRTIINSDNKSYQWFAPAGTRRGGVDNATSVGYITEEGEFKPVSLFDGLRDVLYNAKVNPIATLTGVGVVAYGQKTRARNASALDRINVARLVVYMRRQLDLLARPFLFEPNDAQTRRELKAATESFLLELVGQRALYDFIVVCDETNNTPSRIDRNELWLDIAVEPVKAVEFIYIPLRLKNTGDIQAGL